ncbi:MAG TPA: stage II sporulation protein M [Candidatus Dormibacteraeota bacterium]
MAIARPNPRKARLVAWRDLRDAAGDLRLALAMTGLALAIPIASAAGIRGLALWGGGGVTSVVERLTVVGAFFVVFLPASFSLVLALESFVGERERATLEVLLSTPLREAEIYFGKVASVLAISLTLCYGALIVYSLAIFPGLGYFPVGALVSLALSTICQVAAMVAGAVIVSANARTMRAANVMASFIILPMSVVLQVEAALILVGRGELLWGFAAVMLVAALILLRMGLAGFSREGLLARDAGGGRLVARLRAALSEAFTNRPVFPRLLWQRRIPIGISALGFPLGAMTGWLAGASHAIPAAVARPALSSLLQAAGAPNPPAAALNFFGHNLTAVLLAAVLAPLTIGLTGFALTFLPGFLFGYAASLSSWPLALSGILPNGLIELPAAIVAGGLLIEIGATMIHMEPGGGWAARLLRAYAEYVRSLPWLALAFAAAAILEAYWG